MSEVEDRAKAEAEEAALVAQASKLPLAEQAAHSNWKIRAHAYDEVKKKAGQVFSSEDPFLDTAGAQGMSWPRQAGCWGRARARCRAARRL
jgi:hypothetical protein